MKKFMIASILLILLPLGSITFANSSYVIPAGKTLFANVAPGCCLESTNTRVVTVNKSFVNANAPGSASVLVRKNGVHVDTINVTVGPSEGIKSCYVTPNNVSSTGNVAMVHAITDRSVKAVKFFINEGGNIREIPVESRDVDGQTYIFKGKFKARTFGKHTVWAKFLRDGVWSSCENGKIDINIENIGASCIGRRRVSDNCIRYIAGKEGFKSSCALDEISRNSYDIGHGETVKRGQIFYNNITRTEAYAKLVNTLNHGVFVDDVNNFLIKNNIKCTQNQFDALLSFTYNLGSSWIYASDLKDIILKAGSSKYAYKGIVTPRDGLNLRVGPNCSAKRILSMKYGEEVDIKDEQRYNGNWIKVSTQGGTEGYCCADYLSIKEVGAGEKDLSLVDKDLFINEFLKYHHAAQKCYRGLLYRRIEELQIFLSNDYSLDGAANKFRFRIPGCILPMLGG